MPQVPQQQQRVAEADVAAAAALAAAFEAIAASLQHLAALGVAAGAGDAAAVLRVLALAVAAAQVEVANLNAVPGAGARAGAVAQSLAKALQCWHAAAFSHEHERRKPPLHFSNFSSHRGTTHTFAAGADGGGRGGKGRGAAPVAKAPRTFKNSAGHKQHSFDERIDPIPRPTLAGKGQSNP